MHEIFTLTLNNVLKILVFIAMGYALRRSKGFPKESGKTLSMLAALIFSPAYTIRSLARDFTVETLSEKLLILGSGILFLAVSVALGYLAVRLLGKTALRKNVLLYALAFTNYGYFGYPLIESVFGSRILVDYIVFSQPLNFATATFGYWLLTQRKDFDLKSFLLAPVVWSPFVGAAIGLSGIRLPGVVEDTLAALGGCMSPTVMILMGFVLGAVSLREMFGHLGAYGLSLVRLLAIPLVGGCIYYLCGARGIWFLLPVLTLAMPIGSNVVVYPESCGVDTRDNAKTVFLSYILAMVLLPLSFSLISHLAGNMS